MSAGEDREGQRSCQQAVEFPAGARESGAKEQVSKARPIKSDAREQGSSQHKQRLISRAGFSKSESREQAEDFPARAQEIRGQNRLNRRRRIRFSIPK